jgi:hypothetical protein
MKMVYHSPLGFEPVEVEIVEIDFLKGSALILLPIERDTILNVIRREEGMEEILCVQREVACASLRPLPR